MGANAQTSVPTFTAGEILTAANMNISARTGIPVFADSTARDAAFGGTGEKTLAEGQFAYLESTNVTQYYDGAAWQSVGVAPGLVLISTTTIGSAVSTVTVTGAFSSTYDNYKILVSGGTASSFQFLTLQLGSTTTGYYAGYFSVVYSNASSAAASDNNAANFTRFGSANTNGLFSSVDLLSPNLAKNTEIIGGWAGNATTGSSTCLQGFLNDTTAYTAFTVAIGGGANMTGGTIKVYGYANS